MAVETGSEKRRILFVDDEQNILDGLRRMLRGMRREWEMAFANGGKSALEMMERQPFDVVVSDMRMPEMDGAALLSQIRGQYPHTARIILSGYAEKEAVLRTVGPAHQYLAKPCEAEDIITTINRAIGLRRYMRDDKLVGLVSGLAHLPTPPKIFCRLLESIGSERSSTDEIARIIGEDVAMTAQILKLTNSAYFALPQRVESLQRAVTLLGTDTLKALVLVSGIFEQLPAEALLAEQMETLSRRCLSIGMAARAIATGDGLSPNDVAHAAFAGVLSHVGTLALQANAPDRFMEAMQMVDSEKLDIIDAERTVFGAAHPEIGGYLLGLWGFADPIIEAVAYHHRPADYTACSPPAVLVRVHAAQHLARAIDKETIPAAPGLDLEWLRGLGLEDRTSHWLELVKELGTNAAGDARND